MTNEYINPASIYNSTRMGFSQAVKANGKMTIYCSGQVAWDKDSNTIGVEDVGAQATQALENLKVVLSEAGAQVSDIVRLRTYVVDLNPSLLEPIGHAVGKFYDGTTPAANTLIGVQALALPEFLIEIEATAEIE